MKKQHDGNFNIMLYAVYIGDLVIILAAIVRFNTCMSETDGLEVSIGGALNTPTRPIYRFVQIAYRAAVNAVHQNMT